MSTAATSPEKPRHIDERITSIGPAELLDAFGNPAGVHDLADLRAWVAPGTREALWPIGQWATETRGSDEAAAVIAAAEDLRRQPPDVTGAGLGRSARYGFHYLGWLEPAVRAWALTGDDRFVWTFEELFREWMRGRDGLIGDWPGLDLIWYSLGTWARASLLLPALDVLAGSLSDAAWGEVMSTLIGGARWACDEHDTFRNGNWQLVSAVHLLHAGSVYPRLTEAEQWRRRGLERLAEHLDNDFYADGGHHERSPGYHAMCLSEVRLATAIDQRYLRTGLDAHPKVAAMHDWLRELTSPAGWVPHLQDSGIVWSGAATEPRPSRSVWLEPSGYAVLRAREHEIRVVVNAGPYVGHELESHSHRAVLDIILEGWGRPLLWEAGGPPDYDDERYQSWFQAGRGHNTVLVDGHDVGADRDVAVEHFEESDGEVVLSARVRTGRFEHRRRLTLRRSEPVRLTVDDWIDAPGRHTYELLWHAPAPWRWMDGEWRAGGDPGVRLHVEDLGDTTVATSEGSARLPDPVTRTDEYAPLHTLSLTRSYGRFTTVVTPIAGQP
ncbi:heparinase II/III family protein [Flindersiella endophytica]